MCADYEWTAWFPSSLYSGLMTSPAETLNYLLQHQPDRVCRQVVDTETREVKKKLQVRYKCLPGTIRHSDFPSYISEDCKLLFEYSVTGWLHKIKFPDLSFSEEYFSKLFCFFSFLKTHFLLYFW